VQGGSTITQQLAKNLFLSNERTLERKIKEAFLSVWLECNLTKKEILQLYLDRMYMGGGTFGVTAAANFYFGKDIKDVTLAEAAMLAGLFKAPTKYAPHVNLPAARARANQVLTNMVEAGFLSPEAALCSPHIDGRADLYSLGCTAYFLLTGCNVFDARTPTACAMAHVQSPPPPMRERCDLPVPAELEAIVMKLLEKDPADRIPSAQGLARSLRKLTNTCGWSPEQAEKWWETNLPKMAAPVPLEDEEEAALTVTAGVVHA